MIKKPEVYISYAWEKQEDGSNWPPILKNLYAALSKEEFKIKIDIHSINYKESIKSFMQEIGRGQYIIAIISEKYLKSINCMYEVLQLMKYPNYRSRIFPILLEGARVYDSKKILEYLKYWDSEINVLNQETKSLSNLVYAKPIFEDIEIMNEIRRIIASFGSTIGDMNVLNPHEHDNTNFKTLTELINTKFIEDNQSITIEFKNKELSEQNNKLKTELDILKFENGKLLFEINSKDLIIQELRKGYFTKEVEEVKKVERLEISIFEKLLGFNRDSTKQDVIKKLGPPIEDDYDEKYRFNTMSFNDSLSFSYYKRSEKIMTIDIDLFITDISEFMKFVKGKKVKDDKLKYLGVHKDKILNDFGAPSDISSDNYEYESDNFNVTFICYDRDDYKCNSIKVQFFGNDK